VQDINKLRLDKECTFDEVPRKRMRRSEGIPFMWKEMCFLCESYVQGVSDKRVVSTLELGVTLSLNCKQRGDDWAVKVLGRLQSCNDLVAEEAVYHVRCLARLKKGLPVDIGKVLCGRPESTASKHAFEKLCDRLEMSCEEELYTLDDLFELMKELNPPNNDSDLYSGKHIKNLLVERYGEHIVFVEIKGRKNVICFKNFCNLK